MPNVGKSTLFNALTKNDVLAANYPFATIEPNTGVVGVPDARLAHLARIFDSAEIIPATVTFVDIAGIVKGASEGAGLGNKFLANIRESNAICQVLRAFHDDDVVHVEGRVSPADDIETINTEMILADLQTLDNAIPRLTKEARNDKAKAPVLAAAEQAVEILNQGTTLFSAGFDSEPVRELSLLTAKPYVYVINCDEQQLIDDEFKSRMRELVAPAEAVFLDAKVEAELVELPADEALELLQSVGQEESGLDALARVILQPSACRLPHGRSEGSSRVDPPSGCHGPEAAGVIHTDFQRRFHQGRGGLLRRIAGCGIHGGGQGARQGPDGGQGLRDGRRRRGGIPLQRVDLERRRQFDQAPVHHSAHTTRTGWNNRRMKRAASESRPMPGVPLTNCETLPGKMTTKNAATTQPSGG